MARRHGFTLVELMIAVLLMGVVVAYLLQTFTVQQRTYVMVDQLAEVQQNARAVSALVERDVRHAGFMVPEAAAACGVDSKTQPDTLFVSDAEPIDPEGLTPDLTAEVATATYGLTVGSDTLTLTDDRLDSSPSYDSNEDGVIDTSDGDFAPDQGAILVDLANPDRGTACGIVESVTAHTSITVDFVNALGATAVNPADLHLVPAHVYRVNGTNLLRDERLLATDVDDFQVAYFFDLDDDDLVAADGSETPGSSEYNSFSGGAVYSSAAWDASTLREIRLNLVLRSAQADPNIEFKQGRFQHTGNRVPDPTPDRFRRRVHTAAIRLRNVGARDTL